MAHIAQIKTIESVVAAGLCTGCGTCAGLCPKHAVVMMIDSSRGIYFPTIDQGVCNKCGLCLRICPGHAVSFNDLGQELFDKELSNAPLGNYLNCYMGYATDNKIRHDAAAGGVVTGLLISALDSGLINGALVTKMRDDRPLEPQSFIARTKAEIISASKSKYCPVPPNVALREIMETDGTYAVVGLACHIQGIRKAMSVIPKLKKRIILCLSLLCSHSDTFFATSSFLHKYCTEKEIKNITHLDYRGGGWPGFVKIHFKNNKIMSIPVEKYMLFHSMCFFEQKRCFLCCDSISRLSDITVMDAWVPEIMHSDKQGTSLLIVRTKEGARLCKQAQFLKVVGLQPFPSTRLIRSQGAQRLSNRDLPVFLLFKKIVNQYLPSYDLVIPSPKPLNYQRALLMSLNSWISSKAILNNFVHPIAQMECTAQRQVIKRLSKQ